MSECVCVYLTPGRRKRHSTRRRGPGLLEDSYPILPDSTPTSPSSAASTPVWNKWWQGSNAPHLQIYLNYINPNQIKSNQITLKFAPLSINLWRILQESESRNEPPFHLLLLLRLLFSLTAIKSIESSFTDKIRNRLATPLPPSSPPPSPPSSSSPPRPPPPPRFLLCFLGHCPRLLGLNIDSDSDRYLDDRHLQNKYNDHIQR